MGSDARCSVWTRRAGRISRAGQRELDRPGSGWMLLPGSGGPGHVLIVSCCIVALARNPGAAILLFLRHVLRLPQQVPWTAPRRNTGLEQLGFCGVTWASLRAGLRTALRVGPPDHATHRTAGPCPPPAPARTCSHTWLWTRRGRKEQRGPTRDGTGGRRRLRWSEPGRAGL